MHPSSHKLGAPGERKRKKKKKVGPNLRIFRKPSHEGKKVKKRARRYLSSLPTPGPQGEGNKRERKRRRAFYVL